MTALKRRFRRIVAPIGATILGGGLLIVGVTTAHAADTLLSQGRPALASSVENTSSSPAAGAFDGNSTTRWGSAWSDPQWLRVDLGGTATITSVQLQWEAAYAKAFEFRRPPDGNAWTDIYSTTTGTGGTQTLTVNGSGRYVRMYGTQRATGYGYSLYEFKVHGNARRLDAHGRIRLCDGGSAGDRGHPVHRDSAGHQPADGRTTSSRRTAR